MSEQKGIIKQNQASMQISRETCSTVWLTVRVQAKTSALDVVKSNTPALNTLIKEDAELPGILIELMILEILEFYGMSWTQSQLRQTCELLYNEYHFINIAELKLFSLRVRSGWFGKIYHKLNPSILMGMATVFFDEILEARAYYVSGKRELPPAGEDAVYVDPARVSEALKEFTISMNENIIKDRDEQEKLFKESVKKQREAYARGQGVDIDHVANEFNKHKNKTT